MRVGVKFHRLLKNLSPIPFGIGDVAEAICSKVWCRGAGESICEELFVDDIFLVRTVFASATFVVIPFWLQELLNPLLALNLLHRWVTRSSSTAPGTPTLKPS